METVVVYRVENSNGEGPYMSYTYHQLSIMSVKHVDSKHPAPFEDGIVDFTREHVCGFSSVSNAKSWFKGYKKLLDKCGFKLSVYEVPAEHVLYGVRQLAFKTESTKLLKTKKLVKTK